MTLNEVSKLTEDEARATLERIMWRNGVVCPHCKTVGNSSRLAGKKHRVGAFQCNNAACREQFTVTVGTILEQSHLPIRTWLMAFAIICSSKKGVSALQLQRQLGLGSYRSAWHMAHRIRYAMSQEPLAKLLRGVVEADETYVGGKPRKGNGEPSKRGRGTSRTPVMVLVERGGRPKAFTVPNVTGRTLKTAIRQNVLPKSTIMTDDFLAYKGIGRGFDGGHLLVNHSAGEYARDDGASTNTAESYFALLKRGIVGSFHSVSKQHLNRYCDEFSYRWSTREMTDAARTIKALEKSSGKRLMYSDTVSR
jgi:transposase-like protein